MTSSSATESVPTQTSRQLLSWNVTGCQLYMVCEPSAPESTLSPDTESNSALNLDPSQMLELVRAEAAAGIQAH